MTESEIIGLKEYEAKVLQQRNERRPVVINQYRLQGVDKVFVNIQTPKAMTEINGKRVLGPTIPTNQRDTVGLLNYVSISTGSVEKDGSVQIEFQSIGHAVLPPLLIKNSALRQAIAAKNALQLITDEAAEALLAMDKIKEGQIIDVPLNYMMLVTAWKGDFVRNKSMGVMGSWKGESETMQLKETAQALRMYDGRTIKIEIEGRTVKVRPDLSMINLGVNKAATELDFRAQIPEVQNVINARGVTKFIEKYEKFQENEIQSMLNRADLSLAARHVLTDCQNILSQKENYVSNNKIEMQKQKIELIKQGSEEELNDYYNQLEIFNESLLKNGENPKRNYSGPSVCCANEAT
jgi:hypothetical protein